MIQLTRFNLMLHSRAHWALKLQTLACTRADHLHVSSAHKRLR